MFYKSVVLLSLVGLRCFAGAFINLGFDDLLTNAPGLVTVSGRPTGNVAALDALPGWQVAQGTNAQTRVQVNVDLLPPENAAAHLGDLRAFPEFVPRGRFALALSRATDAPAWTLEQTGTVPPGTKYLVYRLLWDEFEVLINDEIVLPLNPLDGEVPHRAFTPTNLVYDVERFAGLEVRLTLRGPMGRSSGLPVPPWWGGILDFVRFLGLAPKLTTTRDRDEIVMKWPADKAGYVLEEANALPPEPKWLLWATEPVIVGDSWQVRVPIQPGSRFFHLRLD